MHAWQRDPYQTTDTVEVLACAPGPGGFVVRTTPTILYPEGGGQPADHGSIGGVVVRDVQHGDGGVVHVTDRPVPLGAAAVTVDVARRRDHMQQHTGQHLLSAVLEDGYGASTTSFHLGADVCAIELDVPRVPVALATLEDVLHAHIAAARPVRQREVEPGALAGLGVRSRGLPAGFTGRVRLVEIDGVDLNTCGGTHVRNTAELHTIALLGVEPARGGVRLSFLVGDRVRAALHHARRGQEALTRLLSTGPDAHVEAVERVLDERRELGRALDAARSEAAEAWADRLAAAPGPVLAGHREGVALPWLQAVASRLVAARPEAVVLLTCAAGGATSGHFLLAGPAAHVAAHGPEVARRLAGRGGGAKGRFQGPAASLDARDGVVAWLATQPVVG
ncbi:MAG: alanyl-tRNA editing protein [Alphaproteobacteria bacterium]|nr:alanyl-tRNA editing protein [Alphaproteobacteria bacterium]